MEGQWWIAAIVWRHFREAWMGLPMRFTMDDSVSSRPRRFASFRQATFTFAPTVERAMQIPSVAALAPKDSMVFPVNISLVRTVHLTVEETVGAALACPQMDHRLSTIGLSLGPNRVTSTVNVLQTTTVGSVNSKSRRNPLHHHRHPHRWNPRRSPIRLGPTRQIPIHQGPNRPRNQRQTLHPLLFLVRGLPFRLRCETLAVSSRRRKIVVSLPRPWSRLSTTTVDNYSEVPTVEPP